MSNRLLLALTISAIVIQFHSEPAYAQISEFRITSSGGAAGGRFGFSVSISGDYAVVGAYLDNVNGSRIGSAYVFKRTGTSWAQEAKLVPSDGASWDWFGYSVSISGDYVVVGARLDDDVNGENAGSAYVFKRTGTSWTQEAKLLPSDGAAFDWFGYSVSISGDYLVVGANKADVNGGNTGSAYVFKRSGTSWAQESKLTASDGAADDQFGVSVSISGDYAVVGAFLDDDNGTDAGSAYLFKRSDTTWTEEAKLISSDGAANDQFGVSVSISGDYVVVGAFRDTDVGSSSGSAYVFKRSDTSWTQEAKLLPSEGPGGRFGISVSISGDYAVVGAWLDYDNGINAGSAYLFKRTGTSWSQEVKLLASDGAVSDYFGRSVSISGDYTVVGTFGDDANEDNAGSAYLFNLHKPFVANPIQDIALDKDFGTVIAALLDTVFNDLDLPDDSLRFSVVVSNNIITQNISGDTLFLHSVGDSNGVAQVIVTATDDSAAAVSDTFNITVSPARFSLISPLGDTLNTLLPSFLWNSLIDPDISDSTEYIIRISLTESLQSPIFTGTLIDTSGTLGVPLADDSLYFWSVTAIDLSGKFSLSDTSSSDTSSFLLDKQESPEAFTLISPVDGSGIGSPRPVFTWEASSDPDPRDEVRYTLIVRRVTGPDSIVYKIDGITDSTHQVAVDLEIDNYEWWVIAEDTDNKILDKPSSEIFRLNILVGIEDEFAGIPVDFSLAQNYPNPFNPSTNIKYALPKSSNVSLVIYNLMGQEIIRWDEGNVAPGYYERIWHGTTQSGVPVGSGVYFYRIIARPTSVRRAGDFVQTRKMVLLK